MHRQKGITRPLTTMIGRRQDLIDLVHVLSEPSVRLVTICGPGGIGKTRLAYEVIERIEEDFADGVAFVDLSPVRDPSLIPERLHLVLNDSVPETENIEEDLFDVLEDRQMLLILDNLEHLLAVAPLIVTLLDRCPDLVILATSRERINVAPERVFEIKPLATPDQHMASTIDSISGSDAVQLFIERAKAADRTYSLTPENAADVAAICRRLDGLPLAIELAAARVAEIPPHHILRNFVRILPFLERSPNDPEGRHRTMRDTIAWSFRSLPEEEKKLFSRLAIFEGAFSQEAARAIVLVTATNTSDPGVDVELVQRLGSLVSKNLLNRREWEGSEPRYDMLETMREFGREILIERGELQITREAHAAYCISLAEELRSHVRGEEPGPWLDRIASEINEFRAALEWLIGSGSAYGNQALTLANRLDYFWQWRGHVHEGERWLQAALSISGEEDSSERAIAFLNLGNMDPNVEIARSHYQASLAIFRRLDDKQGVASLLLSLGRIAEQLGDDEQAEAYFTESMERFRDLEFEYGVAMCKQHLGLLAEQHGKYRLALECYDDARSIFERTGNEAESLFAIATMGRLYRLESRLSESESLLSWSVARFRAANIEDGVRYALGEYGWLALESEDMATAISSFRDAIRLAQASRDVDEVLVTSVEGMAKAASNIGEHIRAVEMIASVHAWMKQTGNHRPNHARKEVAIILSVSQHHLSSEQFQFAWNRGDLESIETSCTRALELSPSAPQTVDKSTDVALNNDFGLTKQERKILCFIARGEKNRSIAESLFISERTVAVHVQNILRKLNAENRTHASAIAFHAELCAVS